MYILCCVNVYLCKQCLEMPRNECFPGPTGPGAPGSGRGGEQGSHARAAAAHPPAAQGGEAKGALHTLHPATKRERESSFLFILLLTSS